MSRFSSWSVPEPTRSRLTGLQAVFRKLERLPGFPGAVAPRQDVQAADVALPSAAGAGYTLTLYRLRLLCSNFTTPSIRAKIV